MGIDSSNFGSEAFRAPPYVHLGSDYDPETNIGNSGKISECKPYNPPKRDGCYDREIDVVADQLINRPLLDSTPPLSNKEITVKRPGTPTYKDLDRVLFFDSTARKYLVVGPVDKIAKRTKGEDGKNIPLQSTISDVLNTIDGDNPEIIGTISQGLGGSFNLQLYENAGRMYYKATLTFTITPNGAPPIEVEREIFTNTQNQKDAFVALQAYKEGMIDLFRDQNSAFEADRRRVVLPENWRNETHVSIKLNRTSDHSVEAEKFSFGTEYSRNFIKNGERAFAIKAGSVLKVDTSLAPGAHMATLQLQVAENMSVLKQNMDKLKILNSLFKKKTTFRGVQNTLLFDKLRFKPTAPDSKTWAQLQELKQLHSRMEEIDRDLRAMVDLDPASQAQFASALSQIETEMNLATLILKELLPTQPAKAQVPKPPEAPIDPKRPINQELEQPLNLKEEDVDGEKESPINLLKMSKDGQRVDDSDRVVNRSILLDE